MSRIARRSLLQSLSCLAALAAGLALAAPPAPTPDKGGGKNKVDGSGTIEGMQGSVWSVSINDAKWLVKFDANSQLTVTGVAAVEFLPKAVGAMVRFNADPDAKGKAVTEITDLELFTMVTEVKGKNRKQVQPPGTFNQSGKLVMAKGHRLTVQTASGQEMKLDIAEGTLVKINGAFPQLVSRGDLIKLKGDSSVSGQLVATEATVTLSNTVGELKTKAKAVETKKPADSNN